MESGCKNTGRYESMHLGVRWALVTHTGCFGVRGNRETPPAIASKSFTAPPKERLADHDEGGQSLVPNEVQVRRTNVDVETARAVQIYPQGSAELTVNPSDLIKLMLTKDARGDFYRMLPVAIVPRDILFQSCLKRTFKTGFPKV